MPLGLATCQHTGTRRPQTSRLPARTGPARSESHPRACARQSDEDDVPAQIHAGDDLADDLRESDVATTEGLRVTTDPNQIVAAIRASLRAGGPLVIVATYASVPAISAALTATGPADLLICDEAHHTTGPIGKAWAAPLDQTRLPARRRLFMTATTRTVAPLTASASAPSVEEVEVYSMDDPAIYGPHVRPLSFREAISAGWLSDYQIAVVAVSSDAAASAISAARLRGDNIDTVAAVSQLALLQYLDTHPEMRSVLAFHNRIADSRRWAHSLRHLATRAASPAMVYHVDGTSHRSHRTAAINALKDSSRLTVVSNCQLFAEGVDVPALDAVLFAGPRSSGPDIVQIVGRAIRPHPAGPDHKALIIVPVLDLAGDDSPLDVKVARTSYLAAWQVLTTLAEEDDYVNDALLGWRTAVETSAAPEEQSTGRLSIDTRMLDDVDVADFQLKVVKRTTSHYVLTAQKLAVFLAEPGGASESAAGVSHPRRLPAGRPGSGGASRLSSRFTPGEDRCDIRGAARLGVERKYL